jgi:hypothetical protein
LGFAFIDISYGDFPGNGIAKVHNDKNLFDGGIGQQILIRDVGDIDLRQKAGQVI